MQSYPLITFEWNLPLDTASLLLGLLFGSIGVGYFLYGKKQGLMPPMASGAALMVYPYFVDQPAMLAVIGTALMAVPFFLRR